MGKLIKILKKQGGLNLIKNFFNNGTLFVAVSQFCILGKSRTALEILRLSTHLKLKNKLEKRYKKDLIIFDQLYDNKLNHESSNKVWICWFQGIENAPEIIKKCYESVKNNLKDREVILITEDNMEDYVKFPDYILEKYRKGIITKTHLTDLLRLELLIKYGGLWLDASVYCSNNNIPDYISNSDLFFFQCLKPGRDGHSHINSSWLISSKTNNKILMATKYLCYEYWKYNNYLIDYFLLHDFMAIVLEYYESDWMKIIPVSNSTPHILLLRLFEPYDEVIWNEIKKQTSFHKLSYKFDNDAFNKADTYYKKILEKGD